MIRKIVLAAVITLLSLAVELSVATRAYAEVPGGTKWQPGHYMRVKSVAEAKQFLARGDIQHFKGVQLQLDWSVIEPTKGHVLVQPVGEVLAAAEAVNKYVILHVMDRTFYSVSGCAVIPLGVAYYDGNTGGCGARLWEPEVVQAYVDFFKALGEAFNTDSRLVGVIPFGESSLSMTKKDYPGYSHEGFVEQIKCLYNGIKQAFPNTIVELGFNWPQADSFIGPVVEHIRLAGGGAMTWPDSVPAKRSSWIHYGYASRGVNDFAVTPSAQVVHIGPTETDAVFRMLVDDIGSHTITWNNYHPQLANYIGKQVIPTVNKYAGKINTACPSSLAPCVSEAVKAPPLPSKCEP